MNENLVVALQISVIGMGLVFLAIIVLWGLMLALVRFVKDPPEAAQNVALGAAAPANPPADLTASQLRRRAAVVAVAIALARQRSASQPHEFPLPPTPLVSAWQAVMRTRILSKRGPTR